MIHTPTFHGQRILDVQVLSLVRLDDYPEGLDLEQQ